MQRLKNIPPETIIRELIDDEGLSLTPYRCTAGHLTIAIGHNCDAKPLHPMPQRMTRVEAIALFEKDAAELLDTLLPKLSWLVDQPDFAQLTAFSLAFNVGVTGIMKFKNFLKHMQEGNYQGAAQDLTDSRWFEQVKKRGIKYASILHTESIRHKDVKT